MLKRKPSFQVSAENQLLEKYVLEKGPLQIGYNLAFELQEARQASGISVVEYEHLPGTPLWLTPDTSMSKCHLLVWFRKHKRIEAALNSAQIREINRKQKKGSNFQWRKPSR